MAEVQSEVEIVDEGARDENDRAVVIDGGAPVEANAEAFFFQHADDFDPPLRNLFMVCFQAEGVLVGQVVVWNAAIAASIVVLREFGNGEVKNFVMCSIVLALMLGDIFRTGVLVSVRQMGWKPKVRMLMGLRRLMYVSLVVCALTFLSFIFSGRGKAGVEIVLMFLLLVFAYLIFFGWFHVILELVRPIFFVLLSPFIPIPAVHDMFFPPQPRIFRNHPENKGPPVTLEEVEEKVPSTVFNEDKFKEKGHFLGCPICMNSFEEGEIIRVLQCNHAFHQECVDEWFLANHTTCPWCRESFREDEESENEHHESLENESPV